MKLGHSVFKKELHVYPNGLWVVVIFGICHILLIVDLHVLCVLGCYHNFTMCSLFYVSLVNGTHCFEIFGLKLSQRVFEKELLV